MKRFSMAVAVMLAVAGFAFAADRENFTVTELTLGSNGKVISGTSSSLLEQLYDGSYMVQTGFWEGAKLVSIPSSSFSFMDDFYTFLKSTNVTEATVLMAPWSYTGDGGVAADCTIAGTAGGVLKLITGATSNNEAYIQYGAAETEGFAGITSNSAKKVFFEARVAGPANSVNASTFVGIAEPGCSAANFLIDSTGVLDTNKSYMGFVCGLSSTNTYWNFQIHKADDANTWTCTNVVANSGPATFSRLGFEFDGVRTLTIYGNGGANSRTFTVNDANYPTTTMMSPMVACKSIAASYSPTNNIDYINIIQDR